MHTPGKERRSSSSISMRKRERVLCRLDQKYPQERHDRRTGIDEGTRNGPANTTATAKRKVAGRPEIRDVVTASLANQLPFDWEVGDVEPIGRFARIHNFPRKDYFGSTRSFGSVGVTFAPAAVSAIALVSSRAWPGFFPATIHVISLELLGPNRGS